MYSKDIFEALEKVDFKLRLFFFVYFHSPSVKTDGNFILIHNNAAFCHSDPDEVGEESHPK
ncbi:MAG: hypothetical protein PHW27_10065 [Melioribacteraceae bacterium]|nr:hypothetical protein [Melioribacteraceae bacterium]